MDSFESYVEKSQFEFRQGCKLKQQIHSELGSYLSKRKYLSKCELMITLDRMGYHYTRASDLADYFIERVEGAFERGIYVVASRFVALQSFTPESPAALIAKLKEAEPAYFDPIKWYALSTFQRDLSLMRYSSKIIEELAPYILLHVRAAFKRGLIQAAGMVVTVH